MSIEHVYLVVVAIIAAIACRDPRLHRAAWPRRVAALTVAELTDLLEGCAFREGKAVQIHAIAQRVVEEYDGELPCREEVLRSFRGVGPKCANLVLGIAGGQPRIGVDIHVHRITNRWGYVAGRTPEETLIALEAKLPARYHIEINELLVPFGKHICTGTLPYCSTCPLLEMCAQVGVTKHR